MRQANLVGLLSNWCWNFLLPDGMIPVPQGLSCRSQRWGGPRIWKKRYHDLYSQPSSAVRNASGVALSGATRVVRCVSSSSAAA